MSKAELARKSGLSIVTIDRIEKARVAVRRRKGKLSWHWIWTYLKKIKYLDIKGRLGRYQIKTRRLHWENSNPPSNLKSSD
jgi:hypothetical protein